jgi:exonuclease SbcC
MIIHSLEVENFKKIKSKKLELDGKSVVITGPNEAGKSSLIDAITIALENKGTPEYPITHGEKAGEITVVFKDPVFKTEYKAVRRFTEKGQKLIVTTKNGKELTPPKSALDNILNMVSVDPMELAEMGPVPQARAILSAVGIDVDEYKKRKDPYLEEVKDLRYEIDHIQKQIEEIPEIDEDLEPMDTQEIEQQRNLEDAKREARKSKADEINQKTSEIELLSQESKRALKSNEDLEDEIKDLEEKIKQRKQKIKANEDLINRNSSNIESMNEIVEFKKRELASLPVEKELDFSKQLKEIQENNEKIKLQKNRRSLILKKSNVEQSKKEAQQNANAVDIEMRKVIAETNLPENCTYCVERGMMLLNGFPMKSNQVNTASIIKFGVEFIMLTEPNLKILRMKNWMFLDSKAKKATLQLAEKNGFQVFAEAVTDDEVLGFTIVEGED